MLIFCFFEHLIHLPDMTLELLFTVSQTLVAHAKKLVCSIGCPRSNWCFHFSVLHSNKTVNTIKIKYKIVLSPIKINIFLIISYL